MLRHQRRLRCRRRLRSPNLLPHTGSQLARLPVEPMYGKVLLASGEMGCSEEALAVVAMVSTDVVFHQPRWALGLNDITTSMQWGIKICTANVHELPMFTSPNPPGPGC